tara:strand:- start:322 stop:1212 length:891 start_codon:yes stop_codon:yes gene_type:complete
MTLSHRLRVGAATAPPIIETGLTQYLDFGNTSCYDPSVNTSLVNDLSGNNNYCTIGNDSIFNYGGTSSSYTIPNLSVSSSNGGHVILNKAIGSSYVHSNGSVPVLYRQTDILTDARNINSYVIPDFTWEFWVNVYPYQDYDILNSDWWAIDKTMGYETTNTNGGKFFMPTANASYGYTSGYQNVTYSSSNLINQQYFGWQHIVVSKIGNSSNNFKLYINNILQWTATTNGSNATASYYFLVPSLPNKFFAYWNSYQTNTTYAFDGKWAITRFYGTKGLTASEVEQNWNAERGRFGL